MINEREYEQKLKEILIEINQIDSIISGEEISPQEIEQKMENFKNTYKDMRKYLNSKIKHRLGKHIYWLTIVSKCDFDKEKFKEKIWYFKDFFNQLSEKSRECDICSDIVKPEVEYLRKLLKDKMNFVLGNDLKEGYKIWANPREMRERVVHDLLFNTYHHGERKEDAICDFEGLTDGMYSVSVLNVTKKIIPKEKLKGILHGVKLNYPKKKTGFGYQNAKSVVEKYGGKIWVESFVRKHPYFKVTFALPQYKG